jgi:hypothetical protein
MESESEIKKSNRRPGVASVPWVAPRGGVRAHVFFKCEGWPAATRSGPDPREGGTVARCARCLCRSGRATRRVPSLSNSRRSRCSQDLGVKVTRKKSYNVATFEGAGTPPPPIHYLLRRLRADQSARAERPNGRAPRPMGIAVALPHVAVRPAPSSAPASWIPNRNTVGARLAPLRVGPHPR